MQNGQPLLIENMTIEPVIQPIYSLIQPLYSRAVIKKGKSTFIRLGSEDVILNPKFNLFMHTKISNPHYPPEI